MWVCVSVHVCVCESMCVCVSLVCLRQAAAAFDCYGMRMRICIWPHVADYQSISVSLCLSVCRSGSLPDWVKCGAAARCE